MQVTSRHKKIMQTFGQLLREARVKAGYTTAEELASALGLEGHTYRKYERGQAEPNMETIDRICFLLRVTPNYLMPSAAAKGSRPGGGSAPPSTRH